MEFVGQFFFPQKAGGKSIFKKVIFAPGEKIRAISKSFSKNNFSKKKKKKKKN